jgi:hypothetical protein
MLGLVQKIFVLLHNLRLQYGMTLIEFLLIVAHQLFQTVLMVHFLVIYI